MSIDNGGNGWPEAEYFYSPVVRESYRQGIQFCIWADRYAGHWLFNERMFRSKQIPHGAPNPNECRFVNEFFMGTLYLDAGFEVLNFYRAVEHRPSYEKAKELLGGREAIEFINPNGEKRGRPPDLLVFNDQTKEFRFVECKGKNERFSPSQPTRFAAIENFLHDNPPPCGHPLADPEHRWNGLFPPLGQGQWIHIARLIPSNSVVDATRQTVAVG